MNKRLSPYPPKEGSTGSKSVSRSPSAPKLDDTLNTSFVDDTEDHDLDSQSEGDGDFGNDRLVDLDFDNVDNAEVPSPELLEGKIGQDGLLRIGSQPFKAQLFVRSCPLKEALLRWDTSARKNYQQVDRYLIGDNKDLARDIEALLQRMSDHLDNYGDGSVTAFCDYTGVQNSWAPGPQSPSFEAAYPFVIQDRDRLKYHVNPNVFLISTGLNYAKRRLGPLCLPVAAVAF
ncbi:hypothetical protein ACRE_089860 [Hapsidospora chrysogenum ATCC 11550]|uniref:Uncharacterized protein n=1 Tax=Hapsidospora chrysogenum (strain ATCC 11550 / CBS 779.69 / DSM 880 / IAM 14645 / JCM 23072 / IMI 49137) TaxID=857340 RepID=A0A086STC2_HAPC1|nr:hypothetical protein ACRE_089860 [Hapsidospora chrysogenum ATCC 11550]